MIAQAIIQVMRQKTKEFCRQFEKHAPSTDWAASPRYTISKLGGGLKVGLRKTRKPTK